MLKTGCMYHSKFKYFKLRVLVLPIQSLREESKHKHLAIRAGKSSQDSFVGNGRLAIALYVGKFC